MSMKVSNRQSRGMAPLDRGWGPARGRPRELLGTGNDLCLDLGAGFVGMLS